jgi:hypothetical protein
VRVPRRLYDLIRLDGVRARSPCRAERARTH